MGRITIMTYGPCRILDEYTLHDTQYEQGHGTGTNDIVVDLI